MHPERALHIHQPRQFSKRRRAHPLRWKGGCLASSPMIGVECSRPRGPIPTLTLPPHFFLTITLNPRHHQSGRRRFEPFHHRRVLLEMGHPHGRNRSYGFSGLRRSPLRLRIRMVRRDCLPPRWTRCTWEGQTVASVVAPTMARGQ